MLEIKKYKANIKSKGLKLLITSSVLIFAFICTFRVDHYSGHDADSTSYRLLMGFPIVEITEYKKDVDYRYDSYKKGDIDYYINYHNIFYEVLPTLLGVILPSLIAGYCSFSSKRCSLEQNDNGLSGTRKKLFSTVNLKLPIEKVDSIMVKKNYFNMLSGGKTVVICSSSGRMKFPWVQNADEFVDATVNAIEKAKAANK